MFHDEFDGWDKLAAPEPVTWQEYEAETNADRLKLAETNNCRVVVPDDDQLQVDLDCEESQRAYRHVWKTFVGSMARRGFVARDLWSPSKTKGHYHVTVTVRGYVFGDIERIAWQAILGSDGRRELLNLNRVQAGVVLPVCFFEPNRD